MILKKGFGWDLVEVLVLHVKLPCGHTQEAPESWVMPGGKFSCGIECPSCHRKVYDVVLEGWPAKANDVSEEAT